MIENLKLCKILIVNKQPNAFRPGFWDIDVKYVFSYCLIFKTANGTTISTIPANSIYNLKVTLFGSIDTDISTTSDLFSHDFLGKGPFVNVEGKAVALAAELKFANKCCSSCCNCGCNCGCCTCGCNNNCNCGCNNNCTCGCNNNCTCGCGNNCTCGCGNDYCCDSMGIDSSTQPPTAVLVTIGLFTVIKIFRLVNLLVHSSGYCIPDECSEISPENPCDFFDKIDFPLNIFSPPSSPEFVKKCGLASTNTGSSLNNDCCNACAGVSTGSNCTNPCGCATPPNNNCCCR